MTVGAAAPLQEAGALALKLPDPYYKDLAEGYDRRRKRMLDILDRVGFRTYRPAGAYYVMTDITDLNWDDDVAFARHMVGSSMSLWFPARPSTAPPARRPRIPLASARRTDPGLLIGGFELVTRVEAAVLAVPLRRARGNRRRRGGGSGGRARASRRSSPAAALPGAAGPAADADFVPRFVKAGRKGEVVETSSWPTAASIAGTGRCCTRRGRGACASGDHPAPARYLRGPLLDPADGGRGAPARCSWPWTGHERWA